jgi:glycosyltransferase involved in cell wall biosynthesis
MRKEKKYKILFFIFSLSGGGVQKVMINLLEFFNNNRFEVVLVVIKKEGPYLKQLPENIKVYNLNCGKVYFSLIPFLNILYNENPNLIFSSATTINFVTIVAKLIMFGKPKVIIRQDVDVNKYSLRKFNFFLIKILYPFADNVISLTNDMKKNLIDLNSSNKSTVIYNGISLDKISELKDEYCDISNHSGFKIISIGRLTKQKNFTLLLETFKKIDKEINAKLYILGEGELKDSLISKAKKLKIYKDTYFLGYQDNPYKYLNNSDLFIQTSYYEGLSNALLEAIACGLPVLTTFNPDNIIEDGINGFKVDYNSEDIAEKIFLLNKNIKLKNNISENNIRYSYEFSFLDTVKKYKEEFMKLIETI